MMKNRWLIGVTFMLGLQACDMFEPVPTPIYGWSYVQAKMVTTNGVVNLCDLPKDHSGIADVGDVDFYITQAKNRVMLASGDVAAQTVIIESTKPLWTLAWLLDDGSLPHKLWAKDNCIVEHGKITVYRELVPGERAVPILELIWDSKYYMLPADFVRQMPAYSGSVTVKRLIPNFSGEYTFYVKASGLSFIGNNPCYTGFRVWCE